MDYTTVPVGELVSACAGGEAAAWQEFIRRYHRIITITAYRVARRWGQTSLQLVDDLAQDTYVKLCADSARVMRDFEAQYPGAIYAFLKVVTTNVANDYFKGLHVNKRGGGRATDPLDESESPGCAAGPGGLTGVERALLLDEVDACLRALAPSETRQLDQTIFWLYYRQGLTAREIVALPSIGRSLKGVESTLRRLTQLVRTRLVETRPGKSATPEKGFEPGDRK